MKKLISTIAIFCCATIISSSQTVTIPMDNVVTRFLDNSNQAGDIDMPVDNYGTNAFVNYQGFKLNYLLTEAELVSQVNAILRSNGCSWVTCTSLSKPNTNKDPNFIGRIWFTVAPLGTATSRVLILKAGETSLTVSQGATVYNISTTYASKIVKGQTVEIKMSGSDKDEIYELVKKNGSSWTVSSTVKGTGGSINIKVFSEGEYMVRHKSTGIFMNGTVEFTYYNAYNYTYAITNISNTTRNVSNNGDYKELYFTIPSAVNINEMAEIFSKYNQGLSATWRTQAYTYLSQAGTQNGLTVLKLSVVFAPNTDVASVSYSTGFNFSGTTNWEGEFFQAGGGTRELNGYTTDNNTYIEIEGAKHGGTYFLYNTHTGNSYGHQSLPRDIKIGENLSFQTKEAGDHTIMATFLGGTSGYQLSGKIPIMTDEFIIQNKVIRTTSSNITLDPNGGEIFIDCTFTSAVERSQIQSLLDKYHPYKQGESLYRFTISSFTAGVGCRFRIQVVPNYNNKPRSRTIDSKLIFNASTAQEIFLTQEPGDIDFYNFILESVNDNYTTGVAKLESSQWDVKYRLYREYNGNVTNAQEKYGDGGPLAFNLSGQGLYYLHACQVANEDNWNISIRIPGQVVLSTDGADYKTPYRNYISIKKIHGINSLGYTDITYYDGLGYPLQTIQVEGSSSQNNLITPVVYDNMRRADAKSLLPYSRKDRSARMDDDAIDNQKRYYASRTDLQGADSAFIRNVYDRSGLNRVIKSYNAGKVFYDDNKFKEFRYESNTANEVIKFSYEQSEGTIKAVGYHSAGTLYKNTTIDEDGNTSQSFTNTAGDVILERRFLTSSVKADTYYVYDDYTGYLAAVFPPEASATLNSASQLNFQSPVVNNFCFTYRYGPRGRLVERKIPGKELEYIVYDKGDRPVMTQDGNARAKGKWFITEFDEHRRPIRERVINATYSRAVLQEMFDSGSTSSLYTGGILLAEYRYDSYSGLPSDLQATEYSNDVNDRIDSRTRNEKVYEKIAILDGDGFGQPEYIERAYYYNLHRPIVIRERNHLGGISEYRSRYDYQDNLLWARESHQSGPNAQPDVIETTYVHDWRTRVLSDTTVLNGGEKAAMKYQYDDMGKVEEKWYSLQSGFMGAENYRYNLQGWLSSTWSQVTRRDYRYYDPVYGVKSYTGNISEIATWPTLPNGETFSYHYDGLGRLVDTRQYGNDGTRDKFVERDLTYDLNGNIKTLKRYGAGANLIDNFTYSYTGNSLTGLTNTTPAGSYAYTYDANGNMTRDGLNGLDLEYNFLNLVGNVKKNGTAVASYKWLADGTKAAVEGLDPATGTGGYGFEYLGSLIYVRQNGRLTLESGAFSHGRIESYNSGSGTGYRPRYFVQDHLGSTRHNFTINPVVFNTTDYYASGTVIEAPDIPAVTTRWLYNGKEKQITGGLDLLDYGARMYDPRTMRWRNTDPLAENRPETSPFAFCGNNPIMHIDPDGRDYYQSKSGAIIWQDDNTRKIKIDGETYRNIGASYSVQMVDGSYVNYYQDQAISTSNVALDATQTILNNSDLLGTLLGKDSPLSANSQLGLMTSIIHQAQNDFIGHPVTQTALSAMLFVGTGGIEGLVSIGGLAKGALNVAKGGTSLWPAASGGRTVINGIEYTTHALQRMQPVGTIMEGAALGSRGIPPSVVQNVIKFGQVSAGNTPGTVTRTLGNIRVVTNTAGTRVITVYPL